MDSPQLDDINLIIPTTSPPGQSGAEPASFDTSLLEQAYNQYCERLDNGEWVDAQAFAEHYPSMIRAELRELLLAHQFAALGSSLASRPTSGAPAGPQRWPERGEYFGRYHLLMELGRGAFARVFLAAEPKLGGRLVAVKITPGGGSEARILGPIRHPHIVPVYAIDEDAKSGLTAVCMPYVGSATLSNVCAEAAKQPRLPQEARFILDVVGNVQHPVERSADAVVSPTMQAGTYLDGIRCLGAQIADALAYIHGRGILHLDLKPSNVLLSPDGVPMVLDFNLATTTDATERLVGGTAAYTSPEQLRAMARLGEGEPLTARADVYSLGVMLYELATGQHPFTPIPDDPDLAVMATKLLERQRQGPKPVRQVNPDVDRTLARLIERCLAFAPEDRPPSAAEIAHLLRAGLAPVHRVGRWVGRHPRTVVGTGMTLAAACVMLVAALALRPPYHEREFGAGITAYQERRFEDAVNHFTQVIRVSPENADAYFARGRAHQKQAGTNAWSLALADYTRAEELAQNGRTQAAIGYCLTRLGQPIWGAIKCYEDAIELGYAPAEVHNNLGHCHMQINQPDKAREQLDRAIALDHRLAVAYHNRASVSLQQAVKVINEAKRLPAGEFQRRIKKPLDDGITDVEKAIKLGPMSQDLAFDAARLYATVAEFLGGDKALALKYLRIGIEQHQLDPGRLNDRRLHCLDGHPEFEALKKRPAPPAPPKGYWTVRSVDPIKDPFR